ncbi:MAG: biopolymer transporter ExbD [Candidatus Omnitrophica bacterium]|nr:biopolymer transporter ExbD [Candidatus Omnitrophota bacterium]
MKFKRKIFTEKGHLDIAPLIDIIFLLLIFFMLTSSFIFQPGIKVNLPKAITGEIIQKENLILIVDKDNNIHVDDRMVNADELMSRLNIAGQKEQPVLIKADRMASLGKVVHIWDLCRKENIHKINIATTQGDR